MPNWLTTEAKYALSVLLENAELPSGIVDAWWCENGTTITVTVTDDFAGTDSTTLTIAITKDGPDGP
jgi:hypothetical protein